MKPDFLKNLFCLTVAVVLACAAWEVVPAFRGVRAPWPVAVAAYYAVRREAGWGLAAALWCGFAQDGLDGASRVFGAPFFAAMWFMCLVFVKKQMQDSARATAFAAVALALALEAVRFATLRFSGFPAAATPGHLLARLVITAPAAALAAFVTDFLSRRADLAFGNIREEKVGYAGR
ncbi:MAG: hypothetical protein FWG05_05570 [Kiritimatiellaeota bacterium]|nr:hypothetical protein [Kiritimatiellota bacterium]